MSSRARRQAPLLRAYFTPGEIVKIVARLDDDGYFSAWHPDFCQNPIVCQGTLWGIYYVGHRGKIDSVLPRRWIYSIGGTSLSPGLGSFARGRIRTASGWIGAEVGRIPQGRPASCSRPACGKRGCLVRGRCGSVLPVDRRDRGTTRAGHAAAQTLRSGRDAKPTRALKVRA